MILCDPYATYTIAQSIIQLVDRLMKSEQLPRVRNSSLYIYISIFFVKVKCEPVRFKNCVSFLIEFSTLSKMLIFKLTLKYDT